MQEAAAALTGRQVPPQERAELYRTLNLEVSAEGYPVLRTKEQAQEIYDRWLRPGELFIGPDGKLRRKSRGTAGPDARTPVTPQTEAPSSPSGPPVAVESAEDLSAKIQAGAIPMGGKYVVNGVVFTRTR